MPGVSMSHTDSTENTDGSLTRLCCLRWFKNTRFGVFKMNTNFSLSYIKKKILNVQ